MYWKQNNLHKPIVPTILKQILPHGKLTSFSSIQMSLALGSLSLPPSEKHGKLDNVTPGACFAAIANVRRRPPLAAVLNPGTCCAYQFHVYICVYMWVWLNRRPKESYHFSKQNNVLVNQSLTRQRYLIIQLPVHKIIESDLLMVKANTTHIFLPVILLQNHYKFHMGSSDAISDYYNKLNWSESHCEENRRFLLRSILVLTQMVH